MTCEKDIRMRRQDNPSDNPYLLLFIFIIFGLGSFQPMEELSARLQSDPLAVLLLGVVILLPLQESVLRGNGYLEDKSNTRERESDKTYF